MNDVIGDRKHFYPILEHYEQLLKGQYKGDLTAALRGELPKLTPGVLTVSFHGLMQLGYGFSSGSTRIFSEGLSVIHHSYVAMATPEENLLKPLGNPGDTDFIDVLNVVKRDEELSNFLQYESENLPETFDQRFPEILRFPREMAILMLLHADTIIRYTDRIRMPDCYRKVQAGDLSTVREMCDWLIDSAITMYTFAQRDNDFYMLHGITSAYNLKHIMCELMDANDVIKLIRVYICGVIIAYVVQGCPAEGEEFVHTTKTESDDFWEDVVTDSLKVEDLDEHLYKLIEVCRARSISNSDEHMERIYRAAVTGALAKPFSY